MKWGSIRVRLSVWNAAVLALLLGTFGVVLCLTTQDRIQGALDNEMLVRARRSAAAPPPPPWPGPFHPAEGSPHPRGALTVPPPGSYRGDPPYADRAEPADRAYGAPDHDGQDHGAPDHGAPDDGAPDRGGQDPGGPGDGGGPGGVPPEFGPGRGPVPQWRGIASAGNGDGSRSWNDNLEVLRFVSFLFPRFIARNGQSEGGPGRGLRAAWDPATVADSFRGDEVFSTVDVDGAPVRVVSVPWRRGGEIVGAVQMARDESSYRRLWLGQWRTLWTLLPLALICAGLAGLFLTGRALRPVHQVTQAAAQIGAEDLSRRLQASGDDEFAELARTFNAMIARLEGSFERQRRFTADASHELRTPLTRIKVSTSEALSGEHSLDEYRAALAVADRGADVMSRLIDQLLTLARSDAGQLRLNVEPLDLDDLLHATVTSVVRPGGQPIYVEASGQPIYVMGDGEHLQRVFLNLLENANRHTPESGQILIRAQSNAHTALIQVIDTGEGIPAADLPHVGERFFRVDTSRSRSRGGAGLGLAICRGIVQAHGGTLSVASSPGSGTIVSVSLPAGTPG